MRDLIRRAAGVVAGAAGAAMLATGLVVAGATGAGAAAAPPAIGIEAPLPANAASNQFPDLTSVSCTSSGNCTAVGTYTDSSCNDQGLLLTQTAGIWAAAEATLPGNAATNPGAGRGRGVVCVGGHLHRRRLV